MTGGIFFIFACFTAQNKGGFFCSRQRLHFIPKKNTFRTQFRFFPAVYDILYPVSELHHIRAEAQIYLPLRIDRQVGSQLGTGEMRRYPLTARSADPTAKSVNSNTGVSAKAFACTKAAASGNVPSGTESIDFRTVSAIRQIQPLRGTETAGASCCMRNV